MDIQDTILFLTGVELLDSRMGPVPPVIPAKPTSLTAVADSDSINLNWTNGTTYTHVTVDRKDTGDYSRIAFLGNVTTYDDTTALVNVTYTYQVIGTLNSFPSAPSNSASDTIVPVSLDAPTLLTDQTGTGSSTPDMSWTNNGPGVGGAYDFIKIEEKVGVGAFTEIDSITGDGTEYTHNDPPLVPGSYSYRIRGEVGGQFSGYSNVITMVLPHS